MTTVLARWLLPTLLLTAWPALADVVVLTDGRKLEGEVVETADGYEVRQRYGNVSVPRDDVVRIDRSPAQPASSPRPTEPSPPARRSDPAAAARSTANSCRRSREALTGVQRALDALAEAFDRFAGGNNMRAAKSAARDMSQAGRRFESELQDTTQSFRRFEVASRGMSDAEASSLVGYFRTSVTDLGAIAEDAIDLADRMSRLATAIERSIPLFPAELRDDLSTIRRESVRLQRSLLQAVDELPTILQQLQRLVGRFGGGGANDGAAIGESVGTGFFIAPRRILTNAHVVGSARTVLLQTVQGERRGIVVARTDASSALDLAVIELPDGATGQPLAFAPEAMRPGVTAFAYGYGVLSGDTSTLLVTRGSVCAVQEKEQRLVFDARVNPGNSGGPLLDAGGRWIGVVVAKSRAMEDEGVDSLGFAISGNAVVNWLKENGSEVMKEPGLSTDLAPPDARIRASVVRVVVRNTE